MPTFNRRKYFPGALACFFSQTWENKELIVIDDGDDCIADLIPQDVRIRYFRIDAKHTIGHKRNRACELAHGEYVCHWDDDDWSYPGRMRDQYKLLITNQAGIVGYCSMLFADEELEKAYLYRGDPGFALGTSFFYPRLLWRAHKFADMQICEDSNLLSRAGDALSVDAGNRMVARIHSLNTSDKRELANASWTPQDYAWVKGLMCGGSA